MTGMLLKHYADLLSAKFVKPKQGSLLLNTLREHGLAVDDIEAIDGSYWHVNDKLADIFPGARTAAKGEELRDTYDETGKPVRKTPRMHKSVKYYEEDLRILS